MKTLFRTIAFALLAVLSLQAQGQGDLVDRLDKALGVSLPTEYKTMVRNNTKVQEIMNNEVGAEFTEEFIRREMHTSWGINRQNQLIFVWSAVYNKITGQDLYDGGDGDENRFNDFAEIIEQFEICGKKYVDEFNAYMKQRSTVHIYSGLTGIIRFIILYKNNPSIIYDDEIREANESAEYMVSRCKDLNIDYQLLLPTEVMEFYNIKTDGNQRNTLTCEQATVQLLNILLKEIVKLYNQHGKYDIESIIKDCKEYNIDYRAILQKELGSKQKVDELLKFFGVE